MTAARILIVENVRTAAVDLQLRLERLDYVVVGTAESSEEAIAKIGELNPDIILMNIELREAGDGIKTGELIHAGYKTPVIYLTSSAGQETIHRARSSGPFGYIFLPPNDHQVYATIETAITRNQLENQLDQNRNWLSGILDSIGDGVIALNSHGQIYFINSVAQALTGWDQAEAAGKYIYTVLRLFDEKTHQLLEIPGVENVGGGKKLSKSAETFLISRDGIAIPVQTNINLIKNNRGNTTGIVLALRDVTQDRKALKEIELQAQRAKILEQSASRLSIDLDTKAVLTSICSITNNALNAYASAVFLYDNEIESESEIGVDDPREGSKSIKASSLSLPKSVIESLITIEDPIHIVNDISSLADLPDPELFQAKKINVMVIAGIYRQQLIGLLVSIFPESRKPLEDGELIMLKALIAQAAYSVTNADLFKQIRLGRERHRRLAKSLVDVQEAERRRIASELHDHFGQLLTGLQFMLETVKTQADDTLKPGIDEIQESVRDVIEQVREMSLDLRPSMLDDMGLVPTLQWHFGRFTRQTGILVNFHCDEVLNRFRAEIETAAYRIIQEALTNVARYAQVKNVFVGLAIQHETLWVEVVDKGKGFDTSAILERPTSGLGGMRERAELAGGYLLVRSVLNQGTQVIAALPINENRLERRKNARQGSIGG
ncbi:MAG: histidine kinase [Anaerolineales bacterium]